MSKNRWGQRSQYDGPLVWGGSCSLCLGPALGKQAFLCPDSHCLTTVCVGPARPGLPHCQGLGFPGTSSGGSHTSGRACEGTGEKVIQTGVRQGGGGGETEKALGPSWAAPRGAGRRPWHTQWAASQAGPGLQDLVLVPASVLTCRGT